MINGIKKLRTDPRFGKATFVISVESNYPGAAEVRDRLRDELNNGSLNNIVLAGDLYHTTHRGAGAAEDGAMPISVVSGRRPGALTSDASKWVMCAALKKIVDASEIAPLKDMYCGGAVTPTGRPSSTPAKRWTEVIGQFSGFMYELKENQDPTANLKGRLHGKRQGTDDFVLALSFCAYVLRKWVHEQMVVLTTANLVHCPQMTSVLAQLPQDVATRIRASMVGALIE